MVAILKVATICEVAIDKIFCGSNGNHHDHSPSVMASKMESVNYVSATTNANCSALECRWIYSIEYNVSLIHSHAMVALFFVLRTLRLGPKYRKCVLL